MQLCSRVGRAGETAAAETGRFHSEVAAIFLGRHVGGSLGRAKERMQAAVDGHGLVDADLAVAIIVAFVQFDEFEVVGSIAIDLVGRGEDHRHAPARPPYRLEHVERADEGGDEAGRGTVVDLEGRADLVGLACIHDDDPVRDRQRLFLVMGNEDGGDAELLLDLADLFAQ